MTRETVRRRIEEIGIIPAIRLSSAEDAVFAVEAVAESGIPVAEVTMTTPGAIDAIHELAWKYPDLIVGAGTVLDTEMAQRCLDAGARFLTSPGLDLEVVEFARKQGVVVFPGALTPTEMMAAWKAGADFVKVFPCAPMGGVSYIRTLKTPFPDVPLIASGGVGQQTAADFFRAGVVAIGVGRDLISPEATRRREKKWIRELAKRLLQIVAEARAGLSK
ncbi:MAG TPA: bifunctional 4-hydroxy-2-oxoglutarate aldolase/2-dehydro-3-deoxy-phosphogluconate aldolase [Bryobacteraceae bacterium]